MLANAPDQRLRIGSLRYEKCIAVGEYYSSFNTMLCVTRIAHSEHLQLVKATQFCPATLLIDMIHSPESDHDNRGSSGHDD
jgi:hypothetical protein